MTKDETRAQWADLKAQQINDWHSTEDIQAFTDGAWVLTRLRQHLRYGTKRTMQDLRGAPAVAIAGGF